MHLFLPFIRPAGVFWIQFYKKGELKVNLTELKVFINGRVPLFIGKPEGGSDSRGIT